MTEVTELTTTDSPETPEEPKQETKPPKKLYEVRLLRTKDEFRVGGMLAKVTGDGRLQHAFASESTTLMVSSSIAVLLDRMPRELMLFCADLIGITRDFKEEKKRDAKEAEEEGRAPLNEAELKTKLNDEILEEYGEYPTGTTGRIITEIIEREDFDDFLSSSAQLAKVAGKVFSKLQTNTSNGLASRTTNS